MENPTQNKKGNNMMLVGAVVVLVVLVAIFLMTRGQHAPAATSTVAGAPGTTVAQQTTILPGNGSKGNLSQFGGFLNSSPGPSEGGLLSQQNSSAVP